MKRKQHAIKYKEKILLAIDHEELLTSTPVIKKKM
jgi:hypothetical protein